MTSRRVFCGALFAAAVGRFARDAEATSATHFLPKAQFDEANKLFDLVKHISPTSSERVARRVELLSSALLSRPFQWSPIGEGAGALDSDPLINVFQFDCMTFVETVAALARTTGVQELIDDVIAIRYACAIVRFNARHHFLSGEWLANNLAANVLQDITPRISTKARLKSIKYSIDKAAWWRALRTHPIYGSEGPQINWQRSDADEMMKAAEGMTTASGVVTYLPREAIVEAARSEGPLQSGSVLLVVRPNSPFFGAARTAADPLSHCALAIFQDGRWLLRAASLNKRRVVDLELADYFGPHASRHGRLGAMVLEVQPRHRA